MRGSRLLIGLLVLATVLMDCAVVTAALGQPHFPHLILTVAWALQLSHVSLMATWLALGKTTSPLRLTAVVLVVAAWSWALAALPDAPQPAQWAVLLMAQTVAVSVPLLAARWRGVRLVDVSAAGETGDSADGPTRLQFSIAYLLGWMTALSVTLGTLRYLAPYDSLPFGLLSKWDLVAFLGGHAVLAWATLWAALGTCWPKTRVLTVCAAAATAVAATWSANPGFAGGLFYLAALIGVEALLLLGLLGVFRVAGFRLQVWRGR